MPGRTSPVDAVGRSGDRSSRAASRLSDMRGPRCRRHLVASRSRPGTAFDNSARFRQTVLSTPALSPASESHSACAYREGHTVASCGKLVLCATRKPGMCFAREARVHWFILARMTGRRGPPWGW